MEAIQTTTTLWELLQNNGVLIPVFQRDYAQGRAEKRDLRTKFLKEIKNSLADDKEELLLDFVYGTKTSNGEIAPLDGQQRLTTLWLLMWYAVFCNYDAHKDKIESLKNFSYETRPSSTAFIKWLCGDDFFPKKVEKEKECNYKNKEYSLSEYIQSLNGFHLSWKQDPTIQSILRMLSGTGKDDGIEQVFNDHQSSLNKLFDSNCPIKFYYLDLDGIKQSDKLYVKMNARGEQLTGFENFKADFIGYLSKEEKLKVFTNPDPQNDKYILKKWDVNWTDMFWEKCREVYNNESNDNNKIDNIDDAFFTFIKRFLLNEYIANSGNGKIDKDDEVCKLLYSNEHNEYTLFDTFQTVLNIDVIVNLINVLDNARDDELLKDPELPLLKSKTFTFLPKYEKNKDSEVLIKSATFQERVLMYGICQFLKYHKVCDNNDAFHHWLRVLTNLVYYDEIPNLGEYEKRIKFIRRVSETLVQDKTFNDIYIYDNIVKINDLAPKENKNKNEKQLEEEIKKIEIINNNKNLECIIKGLEALWIFEGRIDCLLNDDNSLLNEIILGKLKEYIGEQRTYLKDNANLTKLFQAIISQVEENKPNELLINDEHNRLREILNDNDMLREAFIKVLKGGDLDTIISNYNNDDWKYALVKDAALWKYAEKGKYKCYNNVYYLYKRINKNEADIDLLRYGNFMRQDGYKTPNAISYNSNNKNWNLEYEDEVTKIFPAEQ